MKKYKKLSDEIQNIRKNIIIAEQESVKANQKAKETYADMQDEEINEVREELWIRCEAYRKTAEKWEELRSSLKDVLHSLYNEKMALEFWKPCNECGEMFKCYLEWEDEPDYCPRCRKNFTNNKTEILILREWDVSEIPFE